jgi:hypothetical protein
LRPEAAVAGEAAHVVGERMKGERRGVKGERAGGREDAALRWGGRVCLTADHVCR